MQELLTVMVTWLSINFGLPNTDQLPAVKLATTIEMAELRYERARAEFPLHVDAQIGVVASAASEFYAVYDNETRTIYLLEGWTGATPAESSVLVHELVHHLQNLQGLEYDCAEAREKPAYQAQARWLELFDTSLTEEFEIDPMTLLVQTNCMH